MGAARFGAAPAAEDDVAVDGVGWADAEASDGGVLLAVFAAGVGVVVLVAGAETVVPATLDTATGSVGSACGGSSGWRSQTHAMICIPAHESVPEAVSNVWPANENGPSPADARIVWLSRGDHWA